MKIKVCLSKQCQYMIRKSILNQMMHHMDGHVMPGELPGLVGLHNDACHWMFLTQVNTIKSF